MSSIAGLTSERYLQATTRFFLIFFGGVGGGGLLAASLFCKLRPAVLDSHKLMVSLEAVLAVVVVYSYWNDADHNDHDEDDAYD